MKIFKSILSISALLFAGNSISQCADEANITSFNFDGKTYEIVKEGKTWMNAATCAVERGGILTEINSQAEQDAIFNALGTAGITNSNTSAPDGGGGAYVWIGGNDFLVEEGNWVWDGNNDGTSTQFWQGTSSGSPIGGLYNNWGNEPDDFQAQDGLAMSLNGWPLGVAGQWNDIDLFNDLFFVIEKENNASTGDILGNNSFSIFPNPASENLNIQSELEIKEIIIYNTLGTIVYTQESVNSDSAKINVEELNIGVYFVEVIDVNGENIVRKVLKR